MQIAGPGLRWFRDHYVTTYTLLDIPLEGSMLGVGIVLSNGTWKQTRDQGRITIQPILL